MSDGAVLRVCQVRSGELESEQSSNQWRASAAFMALLFQTCCIHRAAVWTGQAQPRRAVRQKSGHSWEAA